MFNDRQKALEKLEAELLLEEILEEEDRRKAEEELEAELEAEMPLYRNFSNNYGRVNAYNRDVAQNDMDDYAEEVETAGKRENLRGLVALAVALLAGIFAMLAFWAVRYL